MGSVSDPFTTGGERGIAYTWLTLIASVIAIICSLIMIILIIEMNQRNGHIFLILFMSCFQLFYDLTYFTSGVNVNYTALVVSFVGQVLGGTVSALTSNVIAAISLYVVLYRKSFDVLKYIYIIIGFILVPSITTVFIYLLGVLGGDRLSYLQDVALSDIYYYIRIVSIIINFVLSFGTVYLIKRLTKGKAVLSSAETALTTLAIRLMYYPILQAITRIPIAWYEAEYGFDFDPTSMSEQQFIAQCFMTVVTPLASCGYLCIFLVMQPKAYETMRAMLRCRKSDSIKNQSETYLERPVSEANHNSNIRQTVQTDRSSMFYGVFGLEEDSRDDDELLLLAMNDSIIFSTVELPLSREF